MTEQPVSTHSSNIEFDPATLKYGTDKARSVSRPLSGEICFLAKRSGDIISIGYRSSREHRFITLRPTAEPILRWELVQELRVDSLDIHMAETDDKPCAAIENVRNPRPFHLIDLPPMPVAEFNAKHAAPIPKSHR